MAKHPDVAIIGGGIIGLTCAYFLAKEGLSIEVFDRGDLGKEASWAGAGIIPPGNPDGAGTPIDRLRAIGSARFPGFSDELRELTGIDNGYLHCGGIEFVEVDPTEILDLWRQEGIMFDRIPRSLLQAFEPEIGAASGEPYVARLRFATPRHALIAACERVGFGFARTRRSRASPPVGNNGLAKGVGGTRNDARASTGRAGPGATRSSLHRISAAPAFTPFAVRSYY